MLMADMGAEVVRIDRPGGNGWPNPIMERGRSVVTVDIRTAAGRDYCITATSSADVLIEGFRPGVMERLGLGPEPLLRQNPRLIYARMTGWGQDGPLAKAAGHDINYIALSGALAAIGVPNATAVPWSVRSCDMPKSSGAIRPSAPNGAATLSRWQDDGFTSWFGPAGA